MRAFSNRLWLVGAIALVLLVGEAGSTPGCPFCTMQGQTLTGDVGQASMVLFGTLKDARLNNDGSGSTDLHIEAVVKKHDILGDKKVLTLPRYVPSDDKNPKKFLIFCDVFKGRLDPYKGVELTPESQLVKFLSETQSHKDRPLADRLRHFFDYLNSPDFDVAMEAYRAFQRADYKDYKDMARSLPAATIAKWLRDPKTPPYRYGLYA